MIDKLYRAEKEYVCFLRSSCLTEVEHRDPGVSPRVIHFHDNTCHILSRVQILISRVLVADRRTLRVPVNTGQIALIDDNKMKAETV